MIIKTRFKNILMLALVGLFLLLPTKQLLAEIPYSLAGDTEDAALAASQASQQLSEEAKNMVSLCTMSAAELCGGSATVWNCSAGINSLKLCMDAAEKNNAKLVMTSDWQRRRADVAEAEAKEARRQALALAFRASLSAFTRQLAHDTAVWVASGGRGQKPLFITEGWGAYLTNAADVALGDFIDRVGSVYGMDLCQPDFRVRLAITGGLDYRRPQAVRCSLSRITENWQSAISNADFVLDYRSALKPGENDVTFALIMADRRNSYIGGVVQDAQKSAETNDLFTNIKNIAGNILTPGTFIKKQLESAWDKSDKGMDVFTGTIADTVEEFLNTLVSQLLKNLQSGFFASSGGDKKSKDGINLSELAGLFDFNSSPVISSVKGALNVFSNLVVSKEKVGEKFDVLTKLSTCSDTAKDNPSQTDCVIDQILLQAIKSRKYVKQLDEYKIGDNKTVLDRNFSSQIQSSNLSSDIPYRSVLILRKYRIVPVGWEIAAKMIQDRNYANPFNQKKVEEVKNYSLRFVMDNFENSNSPFYGLIDPYWALKSYETYCRRQSYGAQNVTQVDQSLGITRNEYCSDEQQCLFDDAKGNCQFFGYCYEERKKWDLGGSCEARDNTCQTYQSRSGTTGSYLTNTLDFGNCSAQNAGCRSYATLFNPESRLWNGDILVGADLKRHQVVSSDFSVSGPFTIAEGRYVSNDSKLKLSSPCSLDLCNRLDSVCTWNSTAKTCNFTNSVSCTVPKDGISCLANSCYDNANKITNNPGFETAVAGINVDNASGWTDELSAYNDNNRHYRATGSGRTGTAGSALRAISNGGNDSILLTTLATTTVTANKGYRLSFWARGNINQGSVYVGVFLGNLNLYRDFDASLSSLNRVAVGSGGWSKYTTTFNSGSSTNVMLAIVTAEKTIADVYFDDFEINQVKDSCATDSIRLFTPLVASPQATNKYFDRDAETCNSSADGCTEFIRAKANLGANLIYNGSFENGLDSWQYLGNNISLNNSQVRVTYNTNSIIASDKLAPNYKSAPIEGDQYYAISLDGMQTNSNNSHPVRFEMAFFNEGNSIIGLSDPVSSMTDCFNSGGNTITNSSTPAGANWQRNSCWFKAPTNATKVAFKVFAGNTEGAEAYIKDIKLEKIRSSAVSNSAYSTSDRLGNKATYLKKAPDYLSCYTDTSGAWASTYTLLGILDSRRPECANFANVCTKDEVDCELYTPTNGDPSVPGVVTDADLCRQECVGYQNYKQEATNFVSSMFRSFIADNKLKYCSASNAGCDEFTNLDELGQGAENKEYYTQIKACQKPSDPDGASYYTWEGSGTTGYQLKVFRLRAESNTDSIIGTGAPCSDLQYNQSQSGENAGKNICGTSTAGYCTEADLATNSDCRQFYSSNGAISYRLLSKTVTISDNCHPYRRTMTDISNTTTQGDECRNHNGYYNANSECIYMAIPQEGRICSAQAKGCRAYIGNQGNNVRNVINSNFETQNLDGWVSASSGANSGLMLSSEATFIGGSSLTNINAGNRAGTLMRLVSLKQNRAYTLSFWAKGNTEFNITDIKFTGFTSDVFVGTDNQLKIDNTWRKYDVGPVFFTDTATANKFLEITIPGDNIIYLDNIILKESQSNIFAIENSWFTPLSCDNKFEDPSGAKAKAGTDGLNCSEENSRSGRCYPQEMLGCQSYTDRARNPQYIKSFQSLCRREAVGCEALIDTKNSTNDQAQSFNVGGPAFDDVTIPADETVYLVNDAKFSCASADKGCQRLGLPSVDKFDQIIGYRDVFLKDNPDKYNTIMCQHEELWCEEFASSNSMKYFKDPNSKFCVYGQPAGTVSAGWYKSGTTEACSITANQTFGTGYDVASSKNQPIGPYDNATKLRNNTYGGWVGVCAKEASGCTEFVDTKSSSSDRVYPSLVTDDKAISIRLDANKLYYFNQEFAKKVEGATGNCEYKNIVSWSLNPDISQGKLVYLSAPSEYCILTLKSAIGTDAVVAYAGVYYALAGSVDRSSCNGQYSFDNNCILFDDRSNINYSSSNIGQRYNDYLIYNSEQTQENQPPSVSSPVRDASVVLKVTPDRACQRWIDCTSYEKSVDDKNLSFSFKDKCLNIEGCDSFDANGQCLHRPATTTYSLTNIDKASTLSGFSNDRGSFLNFDQSGTSASLGNGNFERVFNNTKEPVGWLRGLYNCTGPNCNAGYPMAVDLPWNSTLYSVESSISNAREGIGYLKLNGKSGVVSEVVDILPNKEYTLTAWVNTKSLLGSDNIGVRGEIQIQTLKDDNTPATGALNQNPQGWIYGSLLRLAKGNDWTKLSYTFRTPAEANKLKLALFNMNPITGGYDNSKLGGYTLWDDISIKPVLINDNDSTDVISRTCRAFPGANATACQYSDTSKTYYGQYGYCMTPDPFNQQQCLQWWPVDSIAGDIASDYSGFYQDRAPLYYCVEKKYYKKDFASTMSRLGAFGEDSSGFGSNMRLDRYGTGIRLTDFRVDNAWRPLFRYPFIYRFDFKGFLAAVGSTASSKFFFGSASATMYPKAVCAGFVGKVSALVASNGSIGKLCWILDNNPGGERDNEVENEYFCGAKAKNPGAECNDGSDIICKTDCDILGGNCRYMSSACGTVDRGYSNVAGALVCNSSNFLDFNDPGGPDSDLDDKDDKLKDRYECEINNDDRFFAKMWEKIITWISGLWSSIKPQFKEEDIWGGWGAVGTPMPNLEFIIFNVKMPWNVAKAITPNMGTGLLSLASNVITEFSSKLGIDGKLFISTIGVKIVTDQDSEMGGGLTDPDPNNPGDILGYADFWNSITFQDYGDKTGFAILTGGFNANSQIGYCSKIVQVVESSGANKAWTSRLSPNSGYILEGAADCIWNSEKDPPLDSEDKAIPYTVVPKNKCFATSDYCLTKKSWKDEPANLCNNLIGKAEASSKLVYPENKDYKLYCATSNDINNNTATNPPLYAVHIMKQNGVDPIWVKNYFCKKFGSDYYIFRAINASWDYTYSGTDYPPFGSIVAPFGDQYPSGWDSRKTGVGPGDTATSNLTINTDQYVGQNITLSLSTNDGKQPLYYEIPFGQTAPYQARMGQVHSVENLQKLFARSYGYWEFFPDATNFGENKLTTNTKESGRYVAQDSGSGLWGLPTKPDGSIKYCLDASDNDVYNRSLMSDEYCRIKPKVSNITVCNDSGCGRSSGNNTFVPYDTTNSTSTIRRSTPIKLTFTAALDQDQLPIRSMEVIWGDGSETTYSGVALLDRPSISTPFTFYHYYDYARAKSVCGNYCKIKIRITDNWNAENSTTTTYYDVPVQ